MLNSKKLFRKLFMLAVLMILLSACRKQTLKDDPPKVDVQTHTKGLVVEFLEGTGSIKTYVDTSQAVILKLKNTGRSNAENIDVSLVGLNEDFCEFPKKIKFDRDVLYGLSADNPFADEEFADFEIKCSEIKNKKTAIYGYNIVTEYDYNTIFSSTVCVDQRINKLKNVGLPCKRTEKITQLGQGAPIAVTSVQDSSSTKELTYIFTIEDKGNGVLMDELIFNSAKIGSKYLNCFYDSTKNLQITSGETMGTFPKTVKGGTAVKQPKRIVCAKKVDTSNEVYVSLLTLNLGYRYRSLHPAKIEVSKII